MDPTKAQLDARLNPTPTTYSVPSGTGFFRGVGDFGQTLYKMNADGTYTPYNLMDFAKTFRTTWDNAGDLAQTATAKLKEIYGIDYNALPQYNLGDLNQTINNAAQGKYGPSGWEARNFEGDIASFLGANPTAVSGTTQIQGNTQPNTLTADPNRIGVPLDGTYSAQSFNNQANTLGESLLPAGFFRTDAGISSNATIAAGEANRIYTPTPQPISVAGLTSSESPFNIRQTSYSPVYNVQGLNVNAGTGTDLGAEGQKAQKQTEDLMSLINQTLGESSYRSEQEKIEGIDALSSFQNDLMTELNLLKQEAAQFYPKLEEGAVGKGITTELLGRKEQALLRENAFKSLNISAQLDAATGKLGVALQKVQRAVEARFGPIREEIAVKRANLDLLLQSPGFTEEQRKRAQAQKDALDVKSQQVAKMESEQKEIWNLATEAAPALSSLPNGSVILSKIQNAATKEEALQIATDAGVFAEKSDKQVLGSASTGYFSYDPVTGKSTPIGVSGGAGSGTTGSSAAYQPGMLTQLLESQGMKADDATLQGLWSQYGNGGTYSNDAAHNSVLYNALTDGTVGGGTGATDPFILKMLDSSGGKPLSDTFAQKIDKGLVVLSQIGLLQENIKNTDTGPLVGLFRGANPWDTNAQTIKAQLNAIVPNLARGVYGEVGVLTDNDIANYSKTLPNLKSTEDIRNAVLGITVDMVGRSIKNTLAVNEANGKDVSGFVDLYKEILETKDSIFSQIGTGTDEADDAPTSFWGGVSNWLFGTD